jgi:hypothetical protein
MAKVRRHEWEGNYSRKICPHCNTTKEKMYHSAGYRYITSDECVRTEEPKCITRTVNAPASDKVEKQS